MASDFNRSAYAGPDTMTRRIIMMMPTGITERDLARRDDNRPVKPDDIKL
jgi:hypothetical protein